MYGTTFKVLNAQQAKLYNIFKNTKLKLLKTNAAIWFNKMCKTCNALLRMLPVCIGSYLRSVMGKKFVILDIPFSRHSVCT